MAFLSDAFGHAVSVSMVKDNFGDISTADNCRPFMLDSTVCNWFVNHILTNWYQPTIQNVHYSEGLKIWL
jgi:hypothetical protein